MMPPPACKQLMIVLYYDLQKTETINIRKCGDVAAKRIEFFCQLQTKTCSQISDFKFVFSDEKKKHFNREETHISPNPRISEHLLAKNYVNSQPLMCKKKKTMMNFNLSMCNE